MNPPDPPRDERLLSILEAYSEGKVSAYDAACDIQDLGLPGHDDPSAGDVVYWARAVGFGVPAPSLEEAEAEAGLILAHTGRLALRRVRRLALVCLALVAIAFIAPRFVPHPEGGFASGASAALTFLVLLAVACAASFHLLRVTLKDLRVLPRWGRVLGIAPFAVLAAALVGLLVFLRY